MNCDHELSQLMYRFGDVIEFIDLFYCMNCKKLFKKTIEEIKL